MTDRKARVSLCMIVRDEAHNLSACLSPVAHLFDEIVIVDTGSSDNTREVAHGFTPHVYDFAWCDDFAAARNESLRHATADWIFWLDADDRVHPDQVQRLERLLATELEEFATELDKRPRIFLMDTIMKPAEAGKDTLVTSHARLFRRHPELKWKGRVHEQLRPEPISLGYAWEFTDIQIEHVGYHERALAARKSRRKLRLLRMDYALDPHDPSTLFHLALAQLNGNGNGHAEARQLLLQLTKMESAALPHLERVYAALADLALHDGRAAEAVAFADEGLARFSGDMQLLLAKAAALYALQEHQQAAAVLEAILVAVPSRRCAVAALADVQTKIAPRMLAAVRRMQRLDDESEALLAGVLKRFPDDLASWHNLGLLYLDQTNGTKLAQVIGQVAALPGGRVAAGTLAALWHLRLGDVALAGEIIDRLIAEAPSQPCPRMLRAEWLSRNGASWDEQLRALKDVLRVQPGNLEARQWIETIEMRQRSFAVPSASASFGTSVSVLPVAAH